MSEMWEDFRLSVVHLCVSAQTCGRAGWDDVVTEQGSEG